MDEILKRALAALAKGAKPEDVDAWVSRETQGQVSSLKELQAQAQPDTGESVLKGMGRAATEGAMAGWSGEALGPEWQAKLDQFKQAHKWLSGGAELAGGLATAAIPGLGIASRASKGASLLRAIMEGAALSSAAGAVSGAGYAAPGEKTKGAGLGAVVGGVAGGAVPLAGATGGAIMSRLGMLANPSAAAAKIAIRELDAAVLSGKATIPELLAKFTELNAIAPGQVTMADLSPQLRRLLDASMTQSPVVAEAAASQLVPRSVAQPSRMAHSLEGIIGGMPDAPAVIAKQTENLRLLGSSLFDNMAMPPATQQKVAQFFTRPIVKDAAKAASAKAQMAGIVEAGPTLQNAQMVRDFLGSAAQSTPGSAGHLFKTAAKDLATILDEVPGYRAAAQTYRSHRVMVDAIQEGIDALSPGMDPRVITRRLAELQTEGGAKAVDAYRYGMVDELWRNLKRTATNRDAAKALMARSPELDAKLRIAFPKPKELDAVLKMVSGETELEKAMRAGAGSQTGLRAADAARIAAGDQAGATIGAGAIMGGGPGAVTGGLAAAAHAFRDIPNRLQGRVAESMGPNLLQTGTGVEDLLNLVASRNSRMQRSLQLMGLLRGTRSAGMGGLLGGTLAPQ